MFEISVNLKNGSEKLTCSNVCIEDKYLKLQDCKVIDIVGTYICDRFYRLTNVISYDLKEIK